MHIIISRAHKFLRQHAFYALVLSSGLACAILAGRIWRSGQITFAFLVWNLLLAWLPYWFSLWASAEQRRYPRAWWRLLAPGALWLLFLPNAPYLITDLVHLRARAGVPLWYDIALLAAFIFSGCFLAVVSLHTMQALVRRVAGALAGWLFALTAIGLSGLGVYLGRVRRWNSWDLLLRPQAVLADALRPLLDPLAHLHPLAICALSAGLLAVCYIMYQSAYQLGRREALGSTAIGGGLGVTVPPLDFPYVMRGATSPRRASHDDKI